jgi:uncharacterized protein (TIGR03435 family)
MRFQPFILAFALVMPHSPALAQDLSARLTFDVASIRPTSADAADRNGFIKALAGGNGYTAHNIPIKLMISLMYRVPMRQISGGPDWIESDRYDVEAKADHQYTIDDLHTMYQNLLVDRFNFKFHKEVKEGPVYALSVDSSGLRMKVNTSPQDFNIPITFDPDGRAAGVRVPIPYLCWWLGQQLQAEMRPVIDRTGLAGNNYNFTLTFAPVRPPDAPPAEDDTLPTIFDAVKDQLGLKLQPQKGPVEYYVIDHIERPSAN